MRVVLALAALSDLALAALPVPLDQYGLPLSSDGLSVVTHSAPAAPFSPLGSTRLIDHKGEHEALGKLFTCPIAWAPARPGGWGSESAHQGCCMLSTSLYIMRLIYSLHTCRRFQTADAAQPCYTRSAFSWTQHIEARVQGCCSGILYSHAPSVRHAAWRKHPDPDAPARCHKHVAAALAGIPTLANQLGTCTAHGTGSECAWGEMCPETAAALKQWVKTTQWERANPRLRKAHARDLSTQTCLQARYFALGLISQLQQVAWQLFHESMAAKNDAMPAVRDLLQLCRDDKDDPDDKLVVHAHGDAGSLDTCLSAVLHLLGQHGGRNVAEKHVALFAANKPAFFTGDHIKDRRLEKISVGKPSLTATPPPPIAMADNPFTLSVWVRTKLGGVVLAKSRKHGKWASGCAALYVSKAGHIRFFDGPHIGTAARQENEMKGEALDSLSKVNDGFWHHVAVACTVDASKGAKTGNKGKRHGGARDCRMYVDGAFESRRYQKRKLFRADKCSGEAAVLKAGHATRTFPADAVQYFAGRMQHMVYWQRALLGWEVEALVRQDTPLVAGDARADAD